MWPATETEDIDLLWFPYQFSHWIPWLQIQEKRRKGVGAAWRFCWLPADGEDGSLLGDEEPLATGSQQSQVAFASSYQLVRQNERFGQALKPGRLSSPVSRCRRWRHLLGRGDNQHQVSHSSMFWKHHMKGSEITALQNWHLGIFLSILVGKKINKLRSQLWSWWNSLMFSQPILGLVLCSPSEYLGTTVPRDMLTAYRNAICSQSC